MREVDCVLGVGRGRLAVSLPLLALWGGVVSVGGAVALETGATVGAGVQGLASVALLAEGEVGV